MEKQDQQHHRQSTFNISQMSREELEKNIRKSLGGVVNDDEEEGINNKHNASTSINVGLGRGEDFFDVDDDVVQYKNSTDILPENGRDWSKDPKIKSRQTQNAGFSVAWVEKWMQKEKAVANDVRMRFISYVSGQIGLKPQKLMIESDIQSRSFQQTAKIEQLRRYLQNRARFNTETRRQILLLKKKRGDLKSRISQLHEHITQLNRKSLQISTELKTRGLAFENPGNYKSIQLIVDKIIAYLPGNTVPNSPGVSTFIAVPSSLLIISWKLSSFDIRVSNTFVRNNRSFRILIAELASIVVELLKIKVDHAASNPILNKILPKSTPMFEISTKEIPDFINSVNRAVAIIKISSFERSRLSNLIDWVLLMAENVALQTKDSAKELEKIKNKYLEILKKADVKNPSTINKQAAFNHKEAYKTYENDLFDIVKKTVPILITKAEANRAQSQEKIQQFLSAAWFELSKSMNEEKLSDIDLENVRTRHLSERNSLRSTVDKIKLDHTYWIGLQQINESLLLRVPADHPLQLLLAAETKKGDRLAGVTVPTQPLIPENRSLFLFEVWVKYLENNVLSKERRKASDLDDQITDLIDKNASMTEIEAAEGGLEGNMLPLDIADPIRHRPEWMEQPENTGRVRLNSTITSAIDGAVDDLLDNDLLNTLVRETVITNMDEDTKRRGGVQAVFQDSLISDNVAYIPFGNLVAMKIGLMRDFFPTSWKRKETTDSLQNKLKEAYNKIINLTVSYQPATKVFAFYRPTPEEKAMKLALRLRNRGRRFNPYGSLRNTGMYLNRDVSRFIRPRRLPY